MELAEEIVGHAVDTVSGIGWAGTRNGKLLRQIAGLYDAFVTMDRSIEHQQNVSKLPFRVILLHAPSNRLIELRPLIQEILGVLKYARPGRLWHIGA